MALQLQYFKEVRPSHCHGTRNSALQSFAHLQSEFNGFVNRGKSISTAKPLRLDRKALSRVCVRATLETPPVETPRTKGRPGEHKGFIEEMRITAMRLHTKDQSKEGEQVEQPKPLAKWEPTKQGYIQFLVDSKAVYDTMEAVVAKAAHPMYSVFLNTGLERSERLAKDLAWFESDGFTIPPTDIQGQSYAELLTDLSENDPPAFICHFYNVYFAHSAGGRMIGRKISEMVLDGKELEFYKWDGELSDLLTGVKEKLNEVSKEWTREEKDHCLEETEKSFKYSGAILRLLIS